MSVYVCVDAPGVICPYCSAEMTNDWQSKDLWDGDRYIELELQKVVLTDKISGEMHHYCSKCNTYVGLELHKGQILGYEDRGIPFREAIAAVLKDDCQ